MRTDNDGNVIEVGRYGVQTDVEPSAESLARAHGRWAQPLRFHLSIIIVALLVSISVPLMLLTYRQGRSEALSAAEQQMTLLGQRAVDR